jgi:hypothetical protein
VIGEGSGALRFSVCSWYVAGCLCRHLRRLMSGEVGRTTCTSRTYLFSLQKAVNGIPQEWFTAWNDGVIIGMHAWDRTPAPWNCVDSWVQAIKDILSLRRERRRRCSCSCLLYMVTTAIFRVTLTRKLFQLLPYSCVFVARIVFIDDYR